MTCTVVVGQATLRAECGCCCYVLEKSGTISYQPMSTSSSLHIQVGSEEPELARQAANRRPLTQIGTINGTPSSGASEGAAGQVCPARE